MPEATYGKLLAAGMETPLAARELSTEVKGKVSVRLSVLARIFSKGHTVMSPKFISTVHRAYEKLRFQ